MAKIIKKMLKFKDFWIVYVLAVGLFFAAFLNLNRTYKAETDVLIIPRSLSASENSEQIIENVRVVTRWLSFSNLDVERLRKSGILRIITQSQNQYQAGVLNDEAVKTLISASSQYYNIKTDIDIRIIKKSIAKYTGSKAVFLSILESLITSFVLVFLSFYVSFGLFSKKTEVQSRFISSNKQKIKKQEASQKAWLAQERPYSTFSKKAAAPQNLPIAEEPSLFSPAESQPENKQELKEEKPIIREATPEEVKERLNKLLSGKF